MTDSDIRTEEWKTVPGFSDYRFSCHGKARSVDRTDRAGRARKGTELRTRVSNRGYVLIDLIDDDGVKWTKTLHTMILLAHAGPKPPGMEARHLDDNPLNNVWAPGDAEESRMAGGNLIWGTRGENERDRSANNPRPVRPPKPPKTCVRCKGVFTTPGRRCHTCRVTIAKQATVMLQAGVPLEDVAAHLEYPAEHLVSLAVQLGGYGHTPWHVTLRDTLRWMTRRDRSRGGDAT